MEKKESETRLVIWSALCIVAFGAAAIAAAQTSSTSTALCDGIAAQIQHNAEASPDDPIAPLFKGDIHSSRRQANLTSSARSPNLSGRSFTHRPQ